MTVADTTGAVTGDVNMSEGQNKQLKYPLHKRPPISIIIFAASQHILMALAGLLSIPLVIADGVCAGLNDPIRTKMAASSFFMCGICTILQTLIGVRLPILQGPASGFVIVLLAVQNTDEWKCIDPPTVNASMINGTLPDTGVLSQDERLRQLSGTVMAGSLIEIIIGATGLVGWLLRFVGPITVAPVIALIGIGFYKVPIRYSTSSWELALLGAVLMLVFYLYLGHIKVPYPTPSNCKSGRKRGSRIFPILPVLFSTTIVWVLAAVLTYTNVFPNDPTHQRFRARVDAKAKLIEQAPWFYVPYPGQFGMPSFNVGIFIGLIAVYFATLVESVGDYFAAARACQVHAPPNHAVNRGIMMEGIGALLSGAVGTGHATTSYTHNIAAMALTKTANRYILACAGVMLVIVGVVGKFGAVLTTIPEPAIGGVLAVLCGMLVALGLSTLQHVNLNSSRNLLIIGTALFSGIFIPQWVDRYPNYFKTGNKDADNILIVVLGTPMFVGGFIAVILDNTARGSRADRGIDSWRKNTMSAATSDDTTDDSDLTYGWGCQKAMYRVLPCCSKLPFMPPQQTSESYELSSIP